MGSTVKQETKIPPPTPEETALMEMMTGIILPAYMDEAGFEVSKTATPWEQTSQAKDYASKKAALEKQIADTQASFNAAAGSSNPVEAANARQNQGNSLNSLYASLDKLNREEADAKGKYTPTVSYASRKKGGEYSEAVREKYGENSPEYQAAVAKEQEENIQAAQDRDALTKKVLEKTQKFLNGDYSITESDKAFIDEVLAPMRDTYNMAADYLVKEADQSKEGISKAIDQFRNEVEQTGLSMTDAIGVLEDRVNKTGMNMKQALQEEMDLTRQLTKMGLEDFTRDQRLAVSQQASNLGRSPSDPEFQKELQGIVNREIEKVNLETGRYAAEKRMGIEDRTGSGLEEAAKLRLGVAERTGTGREQAAQMGLGLAERTAGLREEAARMRGQGAIQSGQMGSNLRYALGIGMLPEQIQTGMGVDQYQQQLMQQRMAQLGGAMNAPLSLYDTMSKERFAQPTVTTKKSGGIGSILGGILGTGLSAAGSFYGMGLFGK